jgi:uncharacterized protein YueI
MTRSPVYIISPLTAPTLIVLLLASDIPINATATTTPTTIGNAVEEEYE